MCEKMTNSEATRLNPHLITAGHAFEDSFTYLQIVEYKFANFHFLV